MHLSLTNEENLHLRFCTWPVQQAAGTNQWITNCLMVLHLNILGSHRASKPRFLTSKKQYRLKRQSMRWNRQILQPMYTQKFNLHLHYIPWEVPTLNFQKSFLRHRHLKQNWKGLWGNQSPKNWSEGSIRAKFGLGLIPQAPVDWKPPSDVTLDSSIQGNYTLPVRISQYAQGLKQNFQVALLLSQAEFTDLVNLPDFAISFDTRFYGYFESPNIPGIHQESQDNTSRTPLQIRRARTHLTQLPSNVFTAALFFAVALRVNCTR